MVILDSHRRVLDVAKAQIAARHKGSRGPGRIPKEIRREILALVDSGVDGDWVAREVGLSAKSLERWRLETQGSASAAVAIPPPRVFAIEDPPRPASSLRFSVGGLDVTIAASSGQ